MYAYGVGSTYDDADRIALRSLSSQISVHVESVCHYEVSDSNKMFREFFNNSVKAYTAQSLYMAKAKVVEENKDKIRVIRFIRESDVEQVFNHRIKKIRDYCRAGDLAAQEYRVSDALKYYYWSFILLQSHPGKDTLHTSGPDDHGLLLSALPEKINRIFSSLKINITKFETDSVRLVKKVHLSVMTDNHPAECFDFSYWDGDGFTKSSCTDGLASVDFYDSTGLSLRMLRINAEYRNYDLAKSFDPELFTIMEDIRLPVFGKGEFTLPLQQTTSSVKEKPTVTTEEKRNVVAEQIVQKIISALKQDDPASVKQYFAGDGFSLMMKMLSGGKMNILNDVGQLSSVRIMDKTEVRPVPVKFTFQHGQKEFIENLVFTFNASNQVEEVSFSLSTRALSDIISKGSGTREEKYTLIRFLETFKTAYFLRREDYLRQVFSDKALIIVGTMLRTAESQPDLYSMFSNEKVKYIKLSKDQYLERLHQVFLSNEFIRLQFEETLIQRRNGNDKTYGIQLEQYYSSSRYCDKGYLTLILDLNDTVNPKIYVRVWQPTRDEDGSWIGLGSFYN
jgi:hypothetical protein